jgi:hypothetical protein
MLYCPVGAGKDPAYPNNNKFTFPSYPAPSRIKPTESIIRALSSQVSSSPGGTNFLIILDRNSNPPLSEEVRAAEGVV